MSPPGRAGDRWQGGPNPVGLSNLEVASGVVCNIDRRWPAAVDGDADPVRALEAELLPLLERPPLVVAFSGGRDSSALLAVAHRLAQREGLDAPIAMTARWSNDAASDESGWQETVIRSLGVTSWERLEPGDGFDLLGPLATEALVHHGLLWPAPAYVMVPLLRAARGGTLISGEGGDELFGWWPPAAARAAVARHRRPSAASARSAAGACLPYGVARRHFARRVSPYQSWLRPEGRAHQQRALASERAVIPARWPRYLLQQAASRDLMSTVRTIGCLAARERAAYAAPLLAPAFASALGRFGGWAGVGDRSSVMTAVFADLLPAPVLTRVSKANFGGVFWGPQSREFARSWNGSGLPLDLVDPEALRRAWLADRPVYGSALPLQAAWLAAKTPGTTLRGVDPVAHRAVGS